MRDLGPGFRRGDEHNRFANRITRCQSSDRLSLDSARIFWYTDHPDRQGWRRDSATQYLAIRADPCDPCIGLAPEDSLTARSGTPGVVCKHELMLLANRLCSSPRRKPGPRSFMIGRACGYWIPAFAGMTGDSRVVQLAHSGLPTASRPNAGAFGIVSRPTGSRRHGVADTWSPDPDTICCDTEHPDRHGWNRDTTT